MIIEDISRVPEYVITIIKAARAGATKMAVVVSSIGLIGFISNIIGRIGAVSMFFAFVLHITGNNHGIMNLNDIFRTSILSFIIIYASQLLLEKSKEFIFKQMIQGDE